MTESVKTIPTTVTVVDLVTSPQEIPSGLQACNASLCVQCIMQETVARLSPLISRLSHLGIMPETEKIWIKSH